MTTFFKNNNFQTSSCVRPDKIDLNDCLACNGCITSDELDRFSIDTSFLENKNELYSFILSSHAKLNLYTYYSSLVDFNSFEKSLIKYLKLKYKVFKIVDTSYFAKENQQLTISSECPAIVLYVERIYPSLVDHLSTVKTFQQKAVDFLTQYDSNHKIISVMQCYDKKDEISRDNTKIDHFIGTRDFYSSIKDDFSPEITNNFELEIWERSHLKPDDENIISGLENCINVLNKLKSSPEKLKKYIESFSSGIELRICKNGCINGPAQLKNKNEDLEAIYPPSHFYQPIVFGTSKRSFIKSKKKTFNVEW